MSNVISISRSGVIDMTKVVSSQTKRKLNPDMILPASGNVESNAIDEHTSEPIKNVDDLNRISKYLIEHERYRDNMLFILGINFGLRISDLLRIQFGNLINDDCSFKDSFSLLEQKTAHTRTNQRNRTITINDAAVDAITLYLKHKSCRLDDYLFKSESNRGKNENKPMSRMTADRILKNIASELNLSEKVSTHTLRKTFGYHQMLMSGNDPRRLLLLQKIFGHSSSTITLDYIGITRDEIEDAYLGLNLGSGKDYSVFGVRGELRVKQA